MSSYTTELRTILESYLEKTDHVGQKDVSTVIALTRERLFDFEYPIFDETYKPILETKIMRHYYMREIGAETVGLFKLYLEQRMTEIMPYYNQLYRSELIKFNPMWTADYTKDHSGQQDGTSNRDVGEDIGTVKTGKSDTNVNGENNGERGYTEQTSGTGTSHNDSNVTSDETTKGSGTSDTVGQVENETLVDTESKAHVKGTGSGTTSSKDRFSDTPQGSLTNIENNTYLTNATLKDGTTSEMNESNSDDTSNSTTTSRTDSSDGVTTSNEGEKHGKVVTTDNGNTTSTGSKSGNEKTHGTHTETTSTSYTENVDTNRKLTDGNVTKNITQYLEHVQGNTGTSFSKLLMEYRETFLNIDMQIIKDLEELFMLLW